MCIYKYIYKYEYKYKYKYIILNYPKMSQFFSLATRKSL